MVDIKKIISHSKEYGFIFPSSEIYDGLSAVYDYAQNGVLLKNNIREFWWKSMVQMNSDIVGVDASILMHPKTWEASGHVDAFNDPLIDNRDSNKRYRADVLIEDYCEKIEGKINKEIQKAKKNFGADFDQAKFIKTNKRVSDYFNKIDFIKKRLTKLLEDDNLNGLKLLIEELKINCPISGSNNWTDVKQFNLMFDTMVGSSDESSTKIFLRPETAQGIFVNYLNIQKTSRMKIPFGIAQTGKAFRNEIVARQFIFRMREFEQMEMQYFVKPGDQKKWYETWKERRMLWHYSLGFEKENYRFHDHDKLAHYADAATDIQFKFPFGFKELEGIHSRTDFDLGNHEKFSGKKLKYYDIDSDKKYTPYVVETSIGLDRLFLAIISNSLEEEKLDNNSTRTVLKLPKFLAPTKLAILPLLKKDELVKLSKKIKDDLKFDFNLVYDEKDAIGRRYRRQDAIGTPYCITIDHDSLKNETVTIRDRDSMKQDRVKIEEVKKFLNSKIDISIWLKKLSW
ncbi:MAG: glycine--tRNA ligase [Flavobacteriaceae bacterium]|nr:glycine--tRNA ligase [Flavobacteriaceae bacterium]|tara:strand:- start:2401 stop:3936 length:1536 start_codon:yes stop_codon:yes gene_type:complete